jgi:Cdc6-like AAA superfamily ATPase
MLDVMMNLDESFLIAGETGCGKTALISDKLKTSCSGDLTDLLYITINANRLTNVIFASIFITIYLEL